jgi:hypothetical protein
VSRESVLDLAWGRVGYVGDQGRQKQDGDLFSHPKLIPRETLAGEAWGGFSTSRLRVCADHPSSLKLIYNATTPTDLSHLIPSRKPFHHNIWFDFDNSAKPSAKGLARNLPRLLEIRK